MSVEGDKPNLEVVPPAGGEGTPPVTPPDGGAPPTPPDGGDKRTPEQVKVDERVAFLEAQGVMSAKDVAELHELAKIGFAKLKADFEAEQEKTRSGQIDEAKELSKTQFFSKYGGRFTRDKQGNIIVPPDVLQEMFEDNKVEAAKIADQIADEKLTAKETRIQQVKKENESAYYAYWNDPKNADLLNGVCLDDNGEEVRAVDEVNALVNSKAMTPSQAAYTIRKAMKTYKKTQEKYAREADRITRQYEGNWHEDIPDNELPSPIRAARPRLTEVKNKPEGQRGSDSFFDAVVEKERTWSAK